MKRRDVLAAVTGSAALSLSGCISTPEPCAGETWTGIGYALSLFDISYDASADRWTGTCGVTVDFDYVSGGQQGVTNAGIALYSGGGRRIGLAHVGDVMWEQVPEAQRSEMSCGGYQRGDLTVRREFRVDEFPASFGLWYSRIHASVVERASELAYRGESPPDGSVGPGAWESVSSKERTFPPLPDDDPELGEGVSTGKLVGRYRICEREDVRLVDSYCCDVNVRGTIPSPNPYYVAGLRGVRTRQDGETAEVRVAVRDFQRPPDRPCDDGQTTHLGYVVGLSFTEDEPTSFEVVHLDADGTQLERIDVGRER